MITVLIVVPAYCKNRIYFYGKWATSQRSLTKDLPIHAWIEDNNEEISLFFDNKLGTVYITMTDSFGNVLFSQTVDTAETPSFIISMNNTKGECMLSITDGKNQIYSHFSIN